MTPPAADRGSRPRWPAALVAALLGILAAFAPAASAAPSRKATFGIGPANAKGIDGRSSLEFLASPGARLTDHVAVVNLGLQPLTLNLYVVDATVGTDGAFGYLARSAPRLDAAKWITAEMPGHATTIALAPRQTRIVPLSIDVPADATPGDHAAGVITSLTSHVTSSAGKDVAFEQRVALRTFIRISGPLHPQLRVENLSARYHGSRDPFGTGTVTVRYRVENTGNVRLGARQTLSVSGLLGDRHPRRALMNVPLLLPGTSVDVTATVPGVLPQFRLTATVRLFPLIVQGDVDPHVPASVSAATTVWAVPWTLLALVAVLAVLVVVALMVRRRWRARARGRHHRGPSDRSPQADSDAPMTEPDGALR